MTAVPTVAQKQLAFRVLGPLEVAYGADEVAIAGSRQRALLAYLLLHANRVVGTERLIDELFGEEPPENALNSVHTGISRLRRQLAEAGVAEPPIVTRPPGYRFELAPEQLDLDHFERLLEQGRRQLDAGAPEAAGTTLREALALWRGPALADVGTYAFARAEAARLEDLRLAAITERIEADLECGRHAAVLRELEALVAEHPLQERLRGLLMLALYRAGRQADALQAYQDLRRSLVSELGLEPGKPLQRLEQQILTQDPELDAPRRDRPAPAPAGSRTVGGRFAAIAGAAALLVAGIAIAIAALARDGGVPAPAAIAPNSVGVIDPETNRLSAEIPVGVGPKGIVAARGAVWVANTEDSTVSRIDPARLVVHRTIALPGKPSDVAVDENVWVLHNRPGSTRDPFAGNAAVSRIDPEFLSVVSTVDVPAGFGNTFEDPLLASRTGIWVGGPTGVSRVDPGTGDVGPRIALDVADLVLEAGSLWVAQGGGTIARVDPISDIVTSTITLTSVTVPVGLATGGGSIWVASRPGFGCCPARDYGTGTVFRVDSATQEVTATIRVGGHPTGVAAHEDGVWIADAKRNMLLRIDPRTNEIAARIPLGGRPVAVAVGEGAVWVTVT